MRINFMSASSSRTSKLWALGGYFVYNFLKRAILAHELMTNVIENCV